MSIENPLIVVFLCAAFFVEGYLIGKIRERKRLIGTIAMMMAMEDIIRSKGKKCKTCK